MFVASKTSTRASAVLVVPGDMVVLVSQGVSGVLDLFYDLLMMAGRSASLPMKEIGDPGEEMVVAHRWHAGVASRSKPP